MATQGNSNCALFWIALACLAVSTLVPIIFHSADNFWVIWEMVAIVATAVLSMLFWCWEFFVDKTTWQPKNLVATCSGLVIIGALLLIGGELASVLRKLSPRIQLLLLTSGTAAFAVNSGIVWRYFQRRVDQRRANRYEKASAAKYEGCFKFSDLPMACAFLILTIFIWLLKHPDDNAPVVRSFVAGAVAFQIILSNAIYTLEWYDPSCLGRGAPSGRTGPSGDTGQSSKGGD